MLGSDRGSSGPGSGRILGRVLGEGDELTMLVVRRPAIVFNALRGISIDSTVHRL